MKALNKRILHIAWPAIATNITTPLLMLADMAIAGHAGNAVFMAAISIGSTVLSVIYWIFAFLRMGTSGPTAQAFGARDVHAIALILKRSVVVALSSAAIVCAIGFGSGGWLISIVDSAGSASSEAITYLHTALWGAPAVLCNYAVSGWLLGMQHTRPIMWIALATNILNILLSCIFVFVMHSGIRGLAGGTVVAQWMGCIMSLTWATHILRESRILMPTTSGRPLHFGYGRYIVLNGAIMLRTLCLGSVTLWFTHSGAKCGPVVLAANAVLMQFFMIFSYFMDGFANSGEALAGRYVGAANPVMLRRTINALMRWSLFTAVSFSGIYLMCSGLFINLITSDATVRVAASQYSFWTVAIPLAGFAAFAWDGVYIGLTKTPAMLGSMAVAAAIFFGLYVSLTHVLPHTDSNQILWFAFVSYLGVRGAFLYLHYRFTVGSLKTGSSKQRPL